MNVIVVGGFNETIESLEESQYNIKGYIDIVPNEKLVNCKWLGTDGDIENITKENPNANYLIGVDNPYLRKTLHELYKEYGVSLCRFININAIISKSAKVGNGTFIQGLVNISSNVVIGNFVKVNIAANIMHDCVVKDYTTIAPNAVLLGKVIVGANCYIGANATILPNIVIGNNVIVGAGSVVTKNIESNRTVKGNPAK